MVVRRSGGGPLPSQWPWEGWSACTEGDPTVGRGIVSWVDIRETYGRLTSRLAELVGCEKCLISLYEALACARASQPGCIILDLKMPRLGGFEALPAIRQAAPAARVIVLTGSPNRPLRDECRARGADDFMLKPFDPGELLRLTAQAFRRD